MYALIKGSGMLVGIFSSKTRMKDVIKEMIKNNYEYTGCHGNYNFRYIKFEVNEPWLYDDEKPSNNSESVALLSLFTMHTEKFPHKVKTDWSTGEILDMDGDNTTTV